MEPVREKLSSAESSFEGNICEVHSGVDPAKEFVYRILVAGYGITHVTCIKWKVLSMNVSVDS